MNALHAGPTSAAVMRDIFKMHYLPQATSVLDLTYGRGAFWRWAYDFTLITNDLYNEAATDHRHDFTDRSWVWPRASVVVFDPPFTANGPQRGGDRHQDRYGSTRDQRGAPQNIREVHRLLVEGIATACQSAAWGVIVKTQSVVESGKFHDSETLACNELARWGWHIEDKVYFAPHRRSQPPGRGVKHFHNRPSIFLVAKL